jgi:hypothetical protein
MLPERSMVHARATPVPDELADEGALDFAEVPAAVVCAFCGRPDCAGCLDVPEPTQASGVLAIVPWERPGQGVLTRLWATARAATLRPSELFAALPEGGVLAPLSFALLAELASVVGLAISAIPLLGLAPDFVRIALSDPVIYALVVRVIGFGIPALAIAMVVLHALHGVLTDRAARRAGSLHRGRGLRFGLYACGWDLVTLPLGLLIVAVGDGFGVAAKAATQSLAAPAVATRAYLSGVHGLAAPQARQAARSAALTTVAVASISVILVAAGAAWLASR